MSNLVIEVVRASIGRGLEKKNGYSVQVVYRPPMEDMYETVRHHVVFQSEANAKQFLVKFREWYREARKERPYEFPFGKLNLKECWVWNSSNASPLGFMHANPTAELVWSPLKEIPYPLD